MVNRPAKFAELEKHIEDKISTDPSFLSDVAQVLDDPSKDLVDTFKHLEDKLNDLQEGDLSIDELKKHLYTHIKRKIGAFETKIAADILAVDTATPLAESKAKYKEFLDALAVMITDGQENDVDDVITMLNAHSTENNNAQMLAIFNDLKAKVTDFEKMDSSKLPDLVKYMHDQLHELRVLASKHGPYEPLINNFDVAQAAYFTERDKKEGLKRFEELLKRAGTKAQKGIDDADTIVTKEDFVRKLPNTIQAEFNSVLAGGDAMLRYDAEKLVMDKINDECAAQSITLTDAEKDDILADFMALNESSIDDGEKKDVESDRYSEALYERQKITIEGLRGIGEKSLESRRLRLLASARNENGDEVFAEFETEDLNKPSVKAKLKKKYLEKILADRQKVISELYQKNDKDFEARRNGVIEKVRKDKWSRNAKIAAGVALTGAAITGASTFGLAATASFVLVGAAAYGASKLTRLAWDKIERVADSDLFGGASENNGRDRIFGKLSGSVRSGGLNRTDTLRGFSKTMALSLVGGRSLKDASKMKLENNDNDKTFAQMDSYYKREQQLLDKTVSKIINDEVVKGGSNDKVLKEITKEIYKSGGPEDTFYKSLEDSIQSRKGIQIGKRLASFMTAGLVGAGLGSYLFSGAEAAAGSGSAPTPINPDVPLVETPEEGLI